MKPKQRNYKALLTVFELDSMTPKEKTQLNQWLLSIASNVFQEEYGKVARFRLMK